MLTTTLLTAGLLAAALGGPRAPIDGRLGDRVDPPPVQGAWILRPTAPGYGGATMVFEGRQLVFVDATGTMVGTLTVTKSKPTKQMGMRHEGYVDVTTTVMKGEPGRTHAPRRSWVTWEDDGKTGRTCATMPGGKSAAPPRLVGAPEGGTRCWRVRHVGVAPGPLSGAAKGAAKGAAGVKKAPPQLNQQSYCVAACIHRNQARAVGPQVIVEDCRRECSAKKPKK